MLFVTLEGIDGCGKSTQVQRIQNRLSAASYPSILLREPGGTKLSEAVRRLLLDPAMTIDPYAEMLLFSAARAQLVREVVTPALAEGTIVLSDRFFDSTVAYQGGGRGVETAGWLSDFQRRVAGGRVPHRTYYLRIDPAIARRRQSIRGEAQDRMEEEKDTFYQRVVDAYEAIAAREPERIRIIDAGLPVEAVEAAIWADLRTLLTNGAGTGDSASCSPK